MVLALGAMGCMEPPRDERPAESEDLLASGPEIASLTDIMQDLGADMAAAAGGLWVADAGQVAAAAQRIADHPNVSPEDRETIQAVLGREFSAFVAFDQGVHRAAVELAGAAARGSEIPDLLVLYSRVQEGCVACHEMFRTDVASALATGGR